MRIHIVCPSDEVTGSAESLHQFGRAAATLGYDARIAYGGDPIFGAVASAFRSYGLRNDQDVSDEPDTLVLVAHTDVAAVEHLTHARKLVWWLRLDESADAVNAQALAVPDVIHLAQSEFARRFLAAHDVEAALVGDYIPASFLQRTASLIPATKLNTVLYNPDPSDELTPRLIEASAGVLQWVPVTGLSRDEVAEIMAYSKVYVDFGAHAGRTRLPREALAAGCVVITGRRGAAGNDVDLALPEALSFDAADQDAAQSALDRVALSLVRFDDVRADLAACRTGVHEQEAAARASVRSLLEPLLPGANPLADRVEAAQRPLVEPAAPDWVPSHEITVCIASIPPRAKQLCRALKSVVEQTLSPAAVVVEIDHDRTGAAATKNRAIAKASTEWVATFDDDDEMYPQHLQTLWAAAVSTGADVVYSWPEVVGMNDPRPDRFGMPFDADELRRGSYIPSPVLMRTKLALAVGGYQKPPAGIYDDWGLFLALLEAGATFHHVPMRTWRWNVDGTNTSGQPTRW